MENEKQMKSEQALVKKVSDIANVVDLHTFSEDG